MNNVVYFASSLFCFTCFFHQIVLISVVLFAFCIVGDKEECFHFLFQPCLCSLCTNLLKVVHLAISCCFFPCGIGIKDQHLFFWLQICFVSLFIEHFIMLYYHFFDHAKGFFFFSLNMTFSSCY